MDRASQALMALIGADSVPAALMPAVVDVLLRPLKREFRCRICGQRVERNSPDLHEPQCLLAVARPGYGEAAP